MVITKELAQPIVDKLMEVLSNHINIINHEGIIVASTEESRINTFHEGTIEAINIGNKILFYENDISRYKGTKQGITIPIKFHNSFIGAVGITGEPDKITDAASIIKVAVESLIEQEFLTKQSIYKRKAIGNWIENIFADDLEDVDQLKLQAKSLNIDLEETCSIIILGTKPITYSEFSMQEQYISEIVESYVRVKFHSYIGQGIYIIAVKSKNMNDLDHIKEMCEKLFKKLEALKLLSHISVGSPKKGILGYRKSYIEAFHSIKILNKLPGEKKIIYFYECHIFILLEYLPQHIKQEFWDNYFENNKIDKILLETMRVYFDKNQNIIEASNILHIHRNTLLFRLNKIKELYNLDPRCFHDAVILQILIYIQKYL